MTRVATAALLGLIAAGFSPLPVCSLEQAPVRGEGKAQMPLPPSDQQIRQASSVMLRDTRGEQIGSAVVVAEADGGYWIATNRHVVADQKLACVTAGSQSSAAVVLVAGGSKPQAEEDLALLWLPSRKNPALAVADQTGPVDPPELLPLVVATGYPIPLHQDAQGLGYTEDEGLLLPLLKQPLQGGFALAYTSVVEKGMSGGGLFQGRRLIGINGAHSHPLWPGKWMDQNNMPVSESLNQRLEQVSLGIPVQTITQRLKSLAVPRVPLQGNSILCQTSDQKDARAQRF